MTERLFDKDSYIKEFQAVVVACEKKAENVWQIVLDKTAFFPEGGGQAGDRGCLNEIRVTDTKEKAGIIYHETAEPLEIGMTVTGYIDFKERFDKMQQHTGEHILSGIVHGLYGYANVGFHLSEEITTMDFDGELSAEQIRDLEIRANQVVYENHPIQVFYPTREELEHLEYRSKIEIEGQVRLVEIEGVDLCACCAPHVKTTGEVGVIKILNCDRHRGGCRLTIVCGMRAFLDYQRKQDSVRGISAMLSAKPAEVLNAVEHLQEQQKILREQLNSVQAIYLQSELEKIDTSDKLVYIFAESLDTIALRNFVNGAMERCDGICCAFAGNDEGAYQYILGSNAVDMKEFSKCLHEKLDGRGGGKPQMVQGTIRAKAEEIKEYLEETVKRGMILE